jgi:hypothetical protein
MEEQRDPNQPDYSRGPEFDDSGNPTEAAPDANATPDQNANADPNAGADAHQQAPWDAAPPRPAAGREMLVQLQQMIDTMATQAGPVMREVAAKAAELAAIAGEKAGPLAHRAAGATETLGQRVAAKSKDIAVELRRPKGTDEQAAGEFADGPSSGATEESADWPAEPPRDADD